MNLVEVGRKVATQGHAQVPMTMLGSSPVVVRRKNAALRRIERETVRIASRNAGSARPG